MEAAGIERTDQSPKALTQQPLATSEMSVSALCLHCEGTTERCLASYDKTLCRIIELWPLLPVSIRQTIYAMCLDDVQFEA
jgi:hypothetical protein